MEYWNRSTASLPGRFLRSEEPTEKKYPEPTLTAISSVIQAESTVNKCQTQYMAQKKKKKEKNFQQFKFNSENQINLKKGTEKEFIYFL